MALTLDIPVRTSITLPDNWQDCQTPQQLSYWLIARFDELAKTHDIDELKNLVEVLRDYVDSRIDKVERQVTLVDQDNNLNAQKIEAIEDVDQTQNQKIDALEDNDVTQNQKISDIEGVNRTQTQRIQSHTEELNVLNRGLNGLRTTVEAQAEKFAGLTEAVTFNVTSEGQVFDIVDKDVKTYNIVCMSDVGHFGINFEFFEMPPNASEYRFFITAPNKTEGSSDVTAMLYIGGEKIGYTYCGGAVTSFFEGSGGNPRWLGGDLLTLVLTTENNSPKVYAFGEPSIIFPS